MPSTKQQYQDHAEEPSGPVVLGARADGAAPSSAPVVFEGAELAAAIAANQVAIVTDFIVVEDTVTAANRHSAHRGGGHRVARPAPTLRAVRARPGAELQEALPVAAVPRRCVSIVTDLATFKQAVAAAVGGFASGWRLGRVADARQAGCVATDGAFGAIGLGFYEAGGRAAIARDRSAIVAGFARFDRAIAAAVRSFTRVGVFARIADFIYQAIPRLVASADQVCWIAEGAEALAVEGT